MNIFEKVLLGILQTAPAELPIFVHSQHGLLIANASETLLAGVLAQFAPQVAAQPVPQAQPASTSPLSTPTP